MFDKKSVQKLHRIHRIKRFLRGILSFANPLLLALLLAELLVVVLLLVVAVLLVCTTTSITTSAHFEFLKDVYIKQHEANFCLCERGTIRRMEENS